MKKITRVLSAFVLSLAVAALIACAPKNVEKAQSKMEKAGYTVTADTWTKKDDGSVGYILCVKGTSAGSIIGSILDNDSAGLTAYLYSSAKEAKAAYNDSKDEDGKTNLQVSGKWVIWGTDEAVKAFKK